MARILLVEDERDIAALLRAALTTHGYEVDEANDGATALHLVQSMRKYDLVLLDRQMPVMNGLQVLQSLRANPAFKSLRVVMLTSATLTREVDEAFAAGADGYIIKPVELKTLFDKVRAALAPPPKA